MSNTYELRTSRRTRQRLEEARQAGAWMPWLAAALAVMFWGSAAAWIYTFIGVERLREFPPPVLASGAMMIFAPGLVLICAGLMARESLRSSHANAVVLTAARTLLDPAGQAEEDIHSLGSAVVHHITSVNKTLAEAKARIEALKDDIEASVKRTLGAADVLRADSATVVGKLGVEREGLVQINDAIRIQSDTLAKAIPRQAQMMAEAARVAQEEVHKADESLAQRLRTLEDTSRRLAERIDQLDTMGAESRKRAQTLAQALMRLDEQLLQSTHMVEAAMKAGEMAAVASKNTADTLRDAVSDALGAAVKAAAEISERSATVSQEARTTLEQIREIGQQSESTVRTAAIQVRGHTDETEKRIQQMAEMLVAATANASRVAETGLEKARLQIAKASVLFDRMQEPEPAGSSVDDIYDGLPPVRITLPSARDANREGHGSANHAASQAAAAGRMTAQGARPGVDAPVPAPAAAALPPTKVPARASADTTNLSVSTDGGLSWQEMLPGAEDDDSSDGPLAEVLERMKRGGVRVTGIGPSEIRRIAVGARESAGARRRAVIEAAPADVLRTTRLIDGDGWFADLARAFLDMRRTHVLAELENVEASGDAASTRLAIFLLLDAALNGEEDAGKS